MAASINTILIAMLATFRSQTSLKPQGGLLLLLLSTSRTMTTTSSSDKERVSSSVRVKNMSSSLKSVVVPTIANEGPHVDGGVKEEMELLNASEDWYGGVTVVVSEPMEVADFVPRLRHSISKWKEQGKRGLWMKLPINQSHLVDPVVKEGFRFHHAESDYVMLVCWLPEDEPDTLPVNATHRVGIGALVLNENKEVLVVMEKNGAFKGTGYWKLPTGVVDEGEDISAAAAREVKEETGIDAEFVEILAFRQSHKSFFSKSDLFFVCMMRPLTSNITAQESEIAASKWMPINEYVEQPYNKQHGQFRYVAEICKARAEGEYVGFSPFPVSSASGKDVYLYYNKQDGSRL
ncbi:unnamed protein product [Linum tenue]|uniref:Nudix hydrolase domain-containing protein n=1 Tax=Linum tenue TaxID=586396 RepID=A0AAV0LDZ8_9ROSI|nr:unnamed protein product [Linum tenue]